jgi:hypothetical protein
MKTGCEFDVLYYKFTAAFQLPLWRKYKKENTHWKNYMEENAHTGGTRGRKIHTLEELYEGKYTHWRNYMKENTHSGGTI